MVSLFGRGFDSLQLHKVFRCWGLTLVRALRPKGQSDFVERDSLQLHKKDYNEIAKNPLESNVTIGSLRPETSAAK